MTGLAFRRKSDIENERLPPELFDAESEEGKAILQSSQPTSPAEGPGNPPHPNGVKAALEKAIATGSIPAASEPTSPITPSSPTGNTSPSTTPFRRGHGRHASLGTTMTSPSTRRRSLESTMSLIKEAVDDAQPVRDPELVKLAEQLAGQRPSSRVSTATTPADSDKSKPAAS